MITYKILLTPTAKRVIDKTYIYYYSSNQIFADKWLSGIRSSIASLATMPKRCAYARENKDFQEEIRQLICSESKSKFRIIFIVNEISKKVIVLTVRHSSMDKLLFLPKIFS